MSIVKTKAYLDLQKTLKLGAQIDQINIIIKMLEKRKKRLLHRMGVTDKNGIINNWLYHYDSSCYIFFNNNNLNRRQIWDGITLQ